MLTIVTWLWKTTGWRKGYSAGHVNALHAMVSQNLDIPHKFVCVTNMPENINCETIPLWDDPLVPGVLAHKPNCYKRLKAFSPEIKQIFGERFISLDLDVVIRGNITDIIDRKEDFIMLKGGSTPYNGSMWMMTAGARKQVWEDFDPRASPAQAKAAKMPSGKNYYGSDQAWISYKLGTKEKTWDENDGIYQYWNGLNRNPGRIPENAKIIFFNGAINPWDNEIRRKCPELFNIYQSYLPRVNPLEI